MEITKFTFNLLYNKISNFFHLHKMKTYKREFIYNPHNNLCL